jgi:hypothetical protein
MGLLLLLLSLLQLHLLVAHLTTRPIATAIHGSLEGASARRVQ